MLRASDKRARCVANSEKRVVVRSHKGYCSPFKRRKLRNISPRLSGGNSRKTLTVMV